MSQQSVVIRNVQLQHFVMWDGEMCVSVFRQVGMHGFPDALLVVRQPDDSMKTYQYNAEYAQVVMNDKDLPSAQQHTQRKANMDLWIKEKLVELATNSTEVSEIEASVGDYIFG